MPHVAVPYPCRPEGASQPLAIGQPDHCEVDPPRGHRVSEGTTGQWSQEGGDALSLSCSRGLSPWGQRPTPLSWPCPAC